MYSQIASLAFNALKGSPSYNVNKMKTNQEIISKLKFIGKLKKGEKVNTRHMYVQPDGLSTTLSRTFLYQDNRGNVLTFAQDTISRSFELLITFERSTSKADKVFYQLLIKDLQNSIEGLANLKTTYIADTKFCCDVDTLLEEIQARLTRFIEDESSVGSLSDDDMD